MDICSSLPPEAACDSIGARDVAALVSVVVPAFNAEATLEQTLRSVGAQNHRRLEILIVDDGSTDGTAAVAQRFCSAEPRARLLRKENGGVASARNLGIAEASGDFIAPIDADDVWHPAKIARQLAAALAAPEPPGFVYCWFRDIDETGEVWRDGPPLSVEGAALQRLACTNFVGNGSTPLFSRRALLAVGGYDERLRRLGAEGCEDLLVQLRLAELYPVAVAAEYLVGYRLTAGSMSSDPNRMFLSWRKSLELLGADRLSSRVLRWSEGSRALSLAETRALRGEMGPALRLLGRALRRDPARSILHLLCRAARHLELKVRSGRPERRDFMDHEPARPSAVTDRWLRILARFDQRRLERIQRVEGAGRP